jgi:hypothetical protein
MEVNYSKQIAQENKCVLIIIHYDFPGFHT